MAIQSDNYASTSQASQYVKEVYAPKVVRLYPETNYLIKSIPFNAANRLGKQYVVPIELAPEQGVTYWGPGAAPAGTSAGVALNGAVGLFTKDATIQPSQIIVQRAVDYESLQRTVGSKAAFVSFIDATMRSVVSLATKRQELSMIHGQSATMYGVAASVSGTGTTANSSHTMTITDAEWAGGLWGGMENALIDIYAADGVTKLNTAGACQITAVDLVGKVVTFTNLAAEAAFGTGSWAAGALINVYSQQASGTAPVVEMAGLHKICSNTGTLFGIDATTAALWKGNSLTSWGAPSIGKILDAVSRLVERGLDEDVVFLCSPKHFARLNSDQTSLVRYPAPTAKTARNGFNEIMLQAAEGVNVKVRGHRFCKDGYAFLLPMSKFQRVGSTELTFSNMGVDGDIFLQIPGIAAVELRGYLGQALLCTAPSRTALISGVTYP